jgi:acyl carrier protein
MIDDTTNKEATNTSDAKNATGVDERLFKMVCELRGIPREELDYSTRLVQDLQLDSVEILEVVTDVENEFQIKITTEDAQGLVTIGDVIRYINANRS